MHVPDIDETVGFSIDHAESGEEALDKIRRQPPDILLLGPQNAGHQRPGGARTTCRHEDRHADDHDHGLCVDRDGRRRNQAGAYDFLAKPFTPDELKSTIRKTAARSILSKQARKLAEERRQVRFEFIRVLGHELKSPLNAVGGYLELMKKRQLGGELAAYDEMVGRSLDRVDGMHKMIRDLLDLTQIESGRKNRNLVEVDVAAAARAAVETVQAEAESRNIGVRIHAAAAVPMQADAREIEMLLNNLLGNAVKYNRDGGSVDVTIQRCDGEIVVTVADTGIGMTPEESGRIFNEFVRIKNEHTQHILGSGLGLAVVKKIVQLYKGLVNVESRPDVGSTFILRLPG